jgi:perosamine synthetase
MFDAIAAFIRAQYPGEGPIPLHAPRFAGREKALLAECIDSTFVSSVGPFVTEFEQRFATYVGSAHAVAVVNGTQALFLALKLLGADAGGEVITQSLTFVATANAIAATGARPLLLDVDRATLGLSPEALERFLRSEVELRLGVPYNRRSGRRLAACVPMHTLGHPGRIEELRSLCDTWGLPLLEDAAESLGSRYRGRHTGSFGRIGIFSFNGNKILTTGGGGMLVTDDPQLAGRARHLSTTAKQPHPWEFVHDELGYNFRLPNLNAALGLAQLERLPLMLEEKRQRAAAYCQFFEGLGVEFVREPAHARSNYWLCSILLADRQQRDALLESTNRQGIQTRPLWRPMHLLELYRDCQGGPLPVTEELYQRLVSLPSGVRGET